jgi:hypothetical protein
MKRERGLFYVKYLGVWFIAGKDIHSAIEYFKRIRGIR